MLVVSSPRAPWAYPSSVSGTLQSLQARLILTYFIILFCLGSLPFLSNYPEIALDKWAKKFGPMFSMWLGDQLFVVVSDPQIVKDLVITNGAIFSSRKEMFMKSKIIFVRRGITATPYDETWYVALCTA